MRFKLAIILALVVMASGIQADAKPIRDSPAAVLKSERAKLVRLNAAYKRACSDTNDARMAYERLRIMQPVTLDREVSEGWKRAIQKAKDAWFDGIETTKKLWAEIDAQEKVVAEAAAAAGSEK